MRGRKRGRETSVYEGNINQLSLAGTPTGDLAFSQQELDPAMFDFAG